MALACDPHRPKEGLLGSAERWNEGLERALYSPARTAAAPGAAETTSSSAFPVYHITRGRIPLPPPGWTLRVRGLVDRPSDFSVQDLQRFPRTDIRVRHHCVEGWSAVASWHGVRLTEIARAVGARPEARFVELRSFDDGYWSSWDRESAEHPQTILAYGMNGEPLSAEHGGPVRQYGAVKLGYKMVKYLEEVSFLPQPTGGYWEDLGYEWYAGV
jgi:DMSO/TMAO reductase YedYZ molybdopterin-dependent catalytic subunit